MLIEEEQDYRYEKWKKEHPDLNKLMEDIKEYKEVIIDKWKNNEDEESIRMKECMEREDREEGKVFDLWLGSLIWNMVMVKNLIL